MLAYWSSNKSNGGLRSWAASRRQAACHQPSACYSVSEQLNSNQFTNPSPPPQSLSILDPSTSRARTHTRYSADGTERVPLGRWACPLAAIPVPETPASPLRLPLRPFPTAATGLRLLSPPPSAAGEAVAAGAAAAEDVGWVVGDVRFARMVDVQVCVCARAFRWFVAPRPRVSLALSSRRICYASLALPPSLLAPLPSAGLHWPDLYI